MLDTQPDSSNLDVSKRYESESQIVCDFDKLDEYLTELHEDEEQVIFIKNSTFWLKILIPVFRLN